MSRLDRESLEEYDDGYTRESFERADEDGDDGEPERTARDLQGDILASPSASFWLKDAVRAAEQRDCLDALNDAEALVYYCQMRAKEAGIKF